MSVQRIWENSRRLKVQTVVTVVVLSAFCATIFPISTPLISLIIHSDENTEPYPCQSCACGCHTAEHCWRNCCCHTHQEKMKWAKKNNVIPPAYFLELLNAEINTATLEKEVAVCETPAKTDCSHNEACSSGSVCSQEAKSVCIVDTSNMCGTYSKTSSKKNSTCCTQPACSHKTTNTKSKETDKPKAEKPVYVIGALALKCQGHSSAINSLPWVTLSKPQVFTFIETTCFYRHPTSYAYESPTIEPPLPPPRSRFS